MNDNTPRVKTKGSLTSMRTLVSFEKNSATLIKNVCYKYKVTPIPSYTYGYYSKSLDVKDMTEKAKPCGCYRPVCGSSLSLDD
jgi:hypothetical protein